MDPVYKKLKLYPAYSSTMERLVTLHMKLNYHVINAHSTYSMIMKKTISHTKKEGVMVSSDRIIATESISTPLALRVFVQVKVEVDIAN